MHIDTSNLIGLITLVVTIIGSINKLERRLTTIETKMEDLIKNKFDWLDDRISRLEIPKHE